MEISHSTYQHLLKYRGVGFEIKKMAEDSTLKKSVHAIVNCDDYLLLTKEGNDVKLFEDGKDANLMTILTSTMQQSENFKTRIFLAVEKYKKIEANEIEKARL